jgi:hypothetical protein
MQKLAEQTCGNHIYMRLMLDNKRVEEIDVIYDNEGNEHFKTSADNSVYNGHEEVRQQIIDAFRKLY